MWPEMFLALVVALPFGVAGLLALFPTSACKLSAWLATSAMAVATSAAALLYPEITGGEVHQLTLPWAPTLGLNFVLRVDGFAWLFLVLISGIGTLVCLYASYYMSPDDPVPKFFAMLLAFAGSMIGLVLSGNVLQLVVFWEMTSILSFLLIGYWRHRPAREGARMALVVTASGGLCLLAGMLMLGRIAGSFELEMILDAGDRIRAHPLYLPALTLTLVGAFTKSAQFPFHFWLPQAMAAPTPVSAYLHSATMVKAGVFVLVRFWPVLSGTDEWFWMVAPIGLLTLLVGGYAAMFQNDLKGMLAYSTISHLGLITFLLGLNTAIACVAAIFHIVNHAMFKAALFMTAGAVDHETGTRDMGRLGGLAKVMPVTATVAMIAAAAMAGVPLLNGFLSKEMFFDVTVRALPSVPFDSDAGLVMLVVLGTVFSVTYSFKFVTAVFLGALSAALPKAPHEPPAWMLVPIGLLAIGCVIIGIVPLTMQPLLELAASSVLGAATPEFKIAIWHGFVPALFMSIAALVGGVALFLLFRSRLLRGITPVIGRLSGKATFDRLYYLFGDTVPQGLEAAFPGERLQPQLRLIFLVVLFAGVVGFGWHAITLPLPALADADVAFALLWTLGSACAVGAAATAKYRRVASLVLLGGAGLISCISFVWLSAPDLAMTQLLVEVVTTILLLLGLRWLPQRAPATAEARMADRTRRHRDLLIAVPVGAALALFAYGVMTHPVENTISRFFLRYSYLEGGGTNVVNVILVDFRAFDTLGEITVLGIVALTVFALLRRFRPARESIGAPAQQRAGAPGEESLIRGRPSHHELPNYMKVPGMIVSLLAPVVLLFALHLLIRGHNLPGGGFAAGLTTSVALILLYMAGGVRWIESRVAVNPVRWIGGGLLLSLMVGVASFAFDLPFLTSYYDYLQLPLIGAVPMSSAFIFDLGVFGLVVGATTLMLIALGHQSLRRPLRRTYTDADGTS